MEKEMLKKIIDLITYNEVVIDSNNVTEYLPQTMVNDLDKKVKAIDKDLLIKMYLEVK
jgi:hypothetical protein